MRGLPLLLLCLLTVHAVAQDKPVAAPSPVVSSREEEALALLGSVRSQSDPAQRIKGLRRLSLYRYASVAEGLEQLLESEQDSPETIREVEWALAAMAGHAMAPLARGVDDGKLPVTSALTILTRIARQDPSIVAPMISGQSPTMARVACIAILGSRHPAATETVLAAWPGLKQEARPAVLQALCNVSRSDCIRLLEEALTGPDDGLRIAAAGLLPTFADPSMATLLIPLLHGNNPVVVRAGLDALMEMRPLGVEKDLAILFDQAPDDIKEQILDILSTMPSKESLAFLQDVSNRYAGVSHVGERARALSLDASGLMVHSGRDRDFPPVAATLLRDGPESFKICLLNSDGFRVIVEGSIEVSCARGKSTRTTVTTSDFATDGTLPIAERCGARIPLVTWVRPSGKRLDAKFEK